MDAIKKIEKLDSFKGVSKTDLLRGNFKKPKSRLVALKKQLRSNESRKFNYQNTVIGLENQLESLNNDLRDLDENDPDRFQLIQQITILNSRVSELDAEILHEKDEIQKTESEIKVGEKIRKEAKDEIAEMAIDASTGYTKIGKYAYRYRKQIIIGIFLGIVLFSIGALMIIYAVQQAQDDPIGTVYRNSCVLTQSDNPDCMIDIIENSLNEQYSPENRGTDTNTN